jgi:hypothetical protein
MYTWVCVDHCGCVLQDGMLKSRETYEIMTPESIGLQRKPEDAGEQQEWTCVRPQLQPSAVYQYLRLPWGSRSTFRH